MKIKKGLCLILACTMLTVVFATESSAAVKTVSFKRGSALMWSKDNITWSYNSTKITNSSADQDCGFIFPNIVRCKGISKVSAYSSSTKHRYKGKKTIGAGVVTPWGDVTVYESDFTDQYDVTKSGTSTWL